LAQFGNIRCCHLVNPGRGVIDNIKLRVAHGSTK
jgi:hypothetical protein